MSDTITAISTSLSAGAINIIRVSGEDCFNIVNKITNLDLYQYEANTINYGFIKDNEEIIDEVLISIFKAPKSYTAEDVIEINCHGGIAVTNKILELLLLNGARLADKGEFTKRAFLNGKIDLIQAEAIMNMIEAKTEVARKLSINSITKKTTNLIDSLRAELVSIIANIEVNIDYPEYEDIQEMDNSLVNSKLGDIITKLEELLNLSQNSKIITNGLNLGIVGKPNVGKSSLLNLLLEEDKAIVSNIEGTTRDIVEGNIIIDGIDIKLIDTAGIRDTTNEIEQLGIEKSKKIINDSDLVLLLFNNSETISKEDIELLNITDESKRIVLVNKSDLATNIDKTLLPNDVTYITTTEEESGNIVKYLISKKLELSDITSKDYTYLTSTRAIVLLKQAIDELKEAKVISETNTYIDIIEIYIKNAWDYLGNITGKSYDEELLDNLFSNYCLGK